MIQNYIFRLLPGKKLFVVGPRSGPNNIFTPTKEPPDAVAQQNSWVEIINSIQGLWGKPVPMTSDEIQDINNHPTDGLQQYLSATDAVARLVEAYSLERTPEGRRDVLRGLQSIMLGPDANNRKVSRAAAGKIVIGADIEYMLSQGNQADEVVTRYQKGNSDAKSVIWMIVQSAVAKEPVDSSIVRSSQYVIAKIRSPIEITPISSAGEQFSRRWMAVSMGVAGALATVGATALPAIFGLATAPIVGGLAILGWSIPQIGKLFGHGDATYTNGVIEGALSQYQQLHELAHVNTASHALLEWVLSPVLFWWNIGASVLGWLSGMLHGLFNRSAAGAVDPARIIAMENFLKSGHAGIEDLTGLVPQPSVASRNWNIIAAYFQTVKDRQRQLAYEKARLQLMPRLSA
jgi:hypothetical protein